MRLNDEPSDPTTTEQSLVMMRMEWPALSAAASTLATFATKLFASELDTVVINCQEDSKEETVSQLKRLREEHPNMPHRKWKAFMRRHQLAKFPVCFLDVPVPRRKSCPCQKHGPDELQVAVQRYNAGDAKE